MKEGTREKKEVREGNKGKEGRKDSTKYLLCPRYKTLS